MRTIVCSALLLCPVLSTGGEEKKDLLPLAFRIGEAQCGPDLTEMAVPGSDRKVFVHKEALLTNEDIAFACARKTKTGNEIEVTLTDSGREKLAKITKDNVGKLLGIIVDGKLVSAPRIMTAIEGGKVVITGKFSMEEAGRIANGILGS